MTLSRTRPSRPLATAAAVTLWLLVASAGAALPRFRDTELLDEEAAAVATYRLPGDVVPDNYKLSIVPYITIGNFSFEGTADITVTVQNATNTITLHAHETLNVDVESVTAVDTQEKLTTSFSRNKTTDFLVITVGGGQTLQVGRQYLISITFWGKLRPDVFYGFYLTSYVAADEVTNKFMATTHFEATHARKAYPCFDEPKYRATFDITIARLPTQHALSNMPLAASSAPDASIGNRIRDTFQQTPRMPTYLVAYIVSELKRVPTSASNVNLYVPDGSQSHAALAADLAPKCIKALEKFTSMKYPLPKVDLVAIPTFAIGAMENWGLVTFREDLLLHSEASSTDHAFTVATVIAHEFAHLWFGDLVTLDWWSSAWLKEGLAEYLQYVIVDLATDGEYNAFSRISCDETQDAMHDDAREDGFPLTDDTVESPEQVSVQMGGLTYSKGAAIFRMFSTVLGETVFRLGLNNYLRKHAYGSATPMDMALALQEMASQYNAIPDSTDMGDLFESWTEKPGFPVLMIQRVYEEPPVLKITAKRFMSHTPADSSALDRAWYIPYNVYWQDEDRQQHHFSNVCPRFAALCGINLWSHKDEQFYALNWQQRGFYRVNYEEENWLKLQANITDAAVFDGSVVAGMLDDAMALSRAGMLDITVSLSFVEAALPSQRTAAPWKMVNAALKGMHALLRADGATDRVFTVYVRRFWLEAAYDALGWTSSAGTSESHDYKVARSVVAELACAYGVPACRKDALRAFLDNQDDLSKIHTDVLGPAVCEALAGLQISNTTYVLTLYVAERDKSRRSAYLYGLGCVQDIATRDALLHDALVSTEPRDVATLVKSFIDHSKTGVEYALDFVVNNYASVLAGIGSSRASALLQTIADRLCTRDQLDKLRQLAATLPNSDLSTSLLVAEANLQWAATASPKILEWATKLIGEGHSKEIIPTAQPTTDPVDPPANPQAGIGPQDASPPDVLEWRLPDDLVPQHYVLSVDPVMEPGNFLYSGTVAITVTVKKTTSKVVLHAAKSLDVTLVGVTDSANTNLAVDAALDRDEEKEFLTIDLGNTNVLAEGNDYTVSLAFSGKLRKDKEGFYLSTYTVGEELKYIATTQMEPAMARKAFPCFDEPRFKSTYSIAVSRAADQVALSNMNILKTDTLDSGRVVDTFDTTPPMSSYLVAFIVSEMKKVSTANPNMNVYVREGAEEDVAYAAEVAPRVLAALETYTGMKYALPKLDLVAIPDFEAGAMENWGLITYRENRLLVSKETSTDRALSVAEVIAHEFAHMWFGDLVTVAQWSSLWQQEGMAALFQRYILDKATDNQYTAMDWLNVEEVHTALEEDAREDAEPATNLNLKSPEDLSDHMGTITYSKGAGFLHMLMSFLGESTFQKGLQKYIATNAFGWATPDGLAKGLQDAADEDKVNTFGVTVSELIESWTSKPGYPVVTVELDYAGNTSTISQARFLSQTPSGDSVMTSRWKIPYNLAVIDESSTTQLISNVLQDTPDQTNTEAVPLTASSYVLLNLQQAGFYRVNYDTRNWMHLARALARGEIPSHAQRAALVDDAVNLALAGQMDTWLAMEVLEGALAGDTSPMVWTVANKALLRLGALARSLALTRELFDRYVEKLLSTNAFSMIGWENQWNIEESYDLKVSRDLVTRVACGAGNILCTTPAYEEFIKWRANASLVNPDVLGATLCVGLADAGVQDYSNAMARMVDQTDRSLRFAYIYGLGCTKENFLLETLLESGSLEEGVEPQEVVKLFSSIIAHNDEGVEIVLAYLSNNLPTIIEKRSLSFAAKLLLVVAERIYSESQFQKIQYLVHLHPSTAMSVVENTASATLRWVRESSLQFRDFLAARLGDTIKPTPQPQQPVTGGAFRLPSSMAPQEYTLRLRPDLAASAFEGEVAIRIAVLEDASNITLNSAELSFGADHVKVTDASGKDVDVSAVEFDKEHELVRVSLAATLPADSECTVTITYSGQIRSDGRGLFSVFHRSNEDNTKSVLVATRLFPAYARLLLPSFDEPRYPAAFSVSVAMNPTLNGMVASNSYLSSDQADGDWVWRTFATTGIIPIHALGLVVSEPQLASSHDGNLDATLYGSADLSGAVEDVTKVAQFMEKALSKGADWTGLSIVAAEVDELPPISAWGLHVFREVDLDLSSGPVERQKRNVLGLVKQVTRHWLGQLTTPEWWDGFWWASGLNTYFQYFTPDQVHADELWSSWSFVDLFRSEVISPAMAMGAVQSSGPLVAMQDFDGPADSIAAAVEALDRGSAAAIVSTIEHSIASHFGDGIGDFMAHRSHAASSPSHLIEALQGRLDAKALPQGATVADVLQTWAGNAGYPVVTTIRDYDTGMVTATQERFLLHEAGPGVELQGSWWIPISLSCKTGSSTEFAPVTHWMQPNASTSIQTKTGQYFCFYSTGKDFFRVNYDMLNWIRFGAYLERTYPYVNPKNRPLLIDDALALAQAGRLEYTLALKVVDSLRREVELEPWKTARDSFAFLTAALLETEAEDAYKEWLQQLLQRVVSSTRFKGYSTDSTRTQLLRRVVIEWACDLDMQACVEPAVAAYTEWRKTTTAPDPNTLSAMVCAGLKNATDLAAEYSALLETLKTEKVDENRLAIIQGLGCIPDLNIAKKFLMFAIEGEGLRGGETVEIFKSVTRFGPKKVELALSYLRGHFYTAIPMLGEEDSASIIQMLTNRVSTAYAAGLARSLAEELSMDVSWLGGLPLLARHNGAWRERNLPLVYEMLCALADLPLPTPPPITPEQTSPSTPAASTRSTTTTSRTPAQTTRVPVTPQPTTSAPTTPTPNPSAAPPATASNLLLTLLTASSVLLLWGVAKCSY